MKKCRLFVLCVFFFAASAAAVGAEAPPKALTLDECVNIALGQNRAVLLSRQTLAGASGRVREAKGIGAPQFNFSGSGQLLSVEEAIPLAVAINPVPTNHLVFESVPIIPKWGEIFSLGVNKVVDISGLIRTGRRVAILGERTAELNVGRTRNEIVFQVKQAYYDVLRKKELLDVAQEAVRNAETRLKTAQTLVDAGVSSKVDTYRAEAAVSSAQQMVISTRNAVEVGKAVLNNVMGRDVDEPLDVQAPPEAIETLASYDSYLKEALENRAEAAIAGTNVLSARDRLKLSKRGRRPSFVLNAARSYNAAHAIPAYGDSSVAAALVFPLSDGGQTKGRAAQAKADIESATLEEQDAKARISLEVKSAFVTLENAGEKCATARKELDQATENLRLSRLRYEQGLTSQLELSDAELLFTQARTNVVNARYDQLAAQALLEKAAGRYGK